MVYNLKAIGKRLHDERKANDIKSQSELADILDYDCGMGLYTRQEIAKWEHGKKMPPVEVLLSLCALYDCDLGYLLCEYDARTRPKTDVMEYTGLSEKAVEKLVELKNQNSQAMKALNTLLTSDNFENSLDYVEDYMEKRAEYEDSKKITKSDVKADEFKDYQYSKYEASTNFSYALDEIEKLIEKDYHRFVN